MGFPVLDGETGSARRLGRPSSEVCAVSSDDLRTRVKPTRGVLFRLPSKKLSDDRSLEV